MANEKMKPQSPEEIARATQEAALEQMRAMMGSIPGMPDMGDMQAQIMAQMQAAVPDLAFDADRAAVRLDELLGDGQPQPAALHFGTRHAEITLENALMVTRVDAPSEIPHVDFDRLFVLYGAHDDARFFGRVVDGVRQQVGDDPRDLLVVDEEFRNLFGIVHLDETAEPLGQNLRSLYGVVYQFDRLGYFRYQFKFAGLDLGHVQQFARDRKQAVAALLDARDELFLLAVQRSQPVVAEQLQTHQDRRNRGFHFVRDGRDEVGLGGVQLLEAGDVVQDDQVADELLFAPADGSDVKRRVLHLEITLLVVGVDFQRLLIRVVRVEFADQPPQQVVRQRHFGGVASDGVLPEVQHRERLAVHKEDSAVGTQPHDRLVQRVDDRLDALFGGHQVAVSYQRGTAGWGS